MKELPIKVRTLLKSSSLKLLAFCEENTIQNLHSCLHLFMQMNGLPGGKNQN